MKKIKLYLTKNLYDASEVAIREKSDVIDLLLLILPEIMFSEPVDNNLGYFEVIVDKMSRVIFTLKREDIVYKRFSFNFPYVISEDCNQDDLLKWEISDGSGFVINSQVISVLMILCREGLFKENIDLSIEPLEFYDRIQHAIKEIDADVTITDTLIWHFVRKLFLFEPGYLRYDLDDNEERCNEQTHPLHHLDFYYSSSATLKIGVAKNNREFQKWKEDSFEQLLDLRLPCYYIKL